MIKIAPSILSADFANLSGALRRAAGADYFHIDVMDGCFVPNITIGAPVVKALRRVTEVPLDVHLMIDRPIRYVPDFLRAGADLITLHVEADTPEQISAALRMIREGGCRAGLSLKPDTPAETLTPWLPSLDLVLVMTVEPGFGGQSFLHAQLPKLEALAWHCGAAGSGCEVSVDGGITAETGALCAAAGARVLVAGSAVYGAEDPAERIRALRAAAEAALPLDSAQDSAAVSAERPQGGPDSTQI